MCQKEKVKGFMDSQDGLNIFIDVTELNTLDVGEDDLRVKQKLEMPFCIKIMDCVVFYLNTSMDTSI